MQPLASIAARNGRVLWRSLTTQLLVVCKLGFGFSSAFKRGGSGQHGLCELPHHCRARCGQQPLDCGVFRECSDHKLRSDICFDRYKEKLSVNISGAACTAQSRCN
jgi:hypothetical protein